MQWVLTIASLSMLIVVHEAGHYLVARYFGMRVNRFSLGFGPGLLKYKSKKTGTVFQVAPLPFGGFVDIDGMNAIDEIDPDDKESYANKPALQRFAAVIAGPTTNFLSAFLLAFILYSVVGARTEHRYFGVGAFTADSVAKGKLELDDRIIAINDKPVLLVEANGKVNSLRKIVNQGDGPVKITVLRNGQKLDYTLDPKPAYDKEGKPEIENGKHTRLLGIKPSEQYERVAVGAGEAIKKSLAYPFLQSQAIYEGIKRIINKEEKMEARGGIGIADEIKKAFDLGFGEGLEIIMALSVYLALFNLLPFPALDGGRLGFLGYELITRRRANPRIEMYVHMFGVLTLVVLMVVVTYQDCGRILSR